MTTTLRSLSLVALLYLISLALSLPVAEEKLDPLMKVIGASRMRGLPIELSSSDEKSPRKRIIPQDLPPSPADLLRPDRFQFYTFDKTGEVITKQMTEKEIQSLIAAGGGHLPPMAMEIHEPQKAGEVPTGGTRVADVVQNVQNVLKSELNKPVPIISSIPTIPGHANSEWSSILPSILAGDMETALVHTPDRITPYIPQEEQIPVIVGSPDYDEANEKPMIQVPVITVEKKPIIKNNSVMIKEEEIDDEDEEVSKPVFQILNTISADQVKNSTTNTEFDQMTDASESINSSNVQPMIVANNQSFINNSLTNDNSDQIKKETISIVSETHSTSVKIPGRDEIKIDNASKPEPDESTMSTSRPTFKPINYDKFEKIESIKPGIFSNVFKESESTLNTSITSTTRLVEITTTKSIESTPAIKQESVNNQYLGPKRNETSSVKTELHADKNQIKDETMNITISSEDTSDATEGTRTSEKIPTAATLKASDPTQSTSPVSTVELMLEKTPTTESILPFSTYRPAEETESTTIRLSPETLASVIEQSGPTTTEKSKGDSLSTELEDSLSSVISQISEAILKPSIVSPVIKDQSILNSDPLESKIEDVDSNQTSTLKSTTESPASVHQPITEPVVLITTLKNVNATKLKEEPNEAPIVRIDIMEAAPTTEILPQLNATESQNYTESPVVRIQLADTVLTVNQIIESASEANVNYGVTPEIEQLTLPPLRGSLDANGIASGLIAGFANNNKTNKDKIQITDDSIVIDIAKKGTKPVAVNKTTITELPSQKTDDIANQLDLHMHKINFDQLPIVHRKKIPVNTKGSGTDKSKISVSSVHNSEGIKMKNDEKKAEILVKPGNSSGNKLGAAEIKDKNNIRLNQTLKTPLVKNDPELPTIQALMSSKIQLNDLPIVHKLSTSEIIKKPLRSKNNTTKADKKPEATDAKLQDDIVTNAYQDDPYKKLGEPLESTAAVTNLSQSNSIQKIKDQKKDSSMEKLELQKLPVVINQITTQKPENPSESATEAAEKLITTSATAVKKQENKESTKPEKWTLIPQQPPHATSNLQAQSKLPDETVGPNVAETDVKQQQVSLNHSKTLDGLDSSVKDLEPDISYFSNLCNDLAFSFWNSTNQGLSSARSLALSPFGMTSMLAMIFLGARGATSDQMNNLLKLDDVASFNPHLVFQNVTDSVGLSRKQGIANAAFVRELFADRMKVRKLLPFYKEQAQQFYDGVVAEVNFSTISDLVRRRTNLMIRKQTGGRIKDFVRSNTVPLRSPLAALSANVFQTDCNSSAASSDGRDGELYFAVSPAIRQRKLVPVPSTVWRSGIFAGYEPNLDATAISLGGIDKLVSTIFVIPGQQGFSAPGDNLELLEERLIRSATYDGAWNKLLKVIIPRPGLELQVPKFSHRSVVNATKALMRMGLHDLFEKQANLKGINGFGSDLHLTDVLQMNLFSTCGDENILSGRHHVEVYPASPQRNARLSIDTQRKEYRDKAPENSASSRPITKATEDTDKPRLKLDRPFLYFVRHNPTGLILHMGRFNPRLLP